MNGIPNSSKKRFRNNTEFIFHFVKDQKQLKFYMGRVLREPSEVTKGRYKRNGLTNPQGKISNGVRIRDEIHNKMLNLVRPDNVFRFQTAGAARDNTIRHPAPYHKELPTYFINLLTDEGDVVLDPFAGISTTGIPCIETNRHFIGYELNPNYVEFGIKRLGGGELETYFINQYDLDDNFIRSWNTITEIETTLGFDSHNHIEDCIRKGNKTSYGYKWILEERKI
jgi:DNA modification methylase